VSTLSRRERITRRVEFIVPAEPPWGACWTEIMKAIHTAHSELRQLGRIEGDRDAPDDLITVHPVDDSIIVSYELDNRNPEESLNLSAVTP
jgi:hypothetical protein